MKNIILFLILSLLLSCAIETKTQLKTPIYDELDVYSFDENLNFIEPDTTMSSEFLNNSRPGFLVKMLLYSEGDTTFLEAFDVIYINGRMCVCPDTATFENYKCVIVYY